MVMLAALMSLFGVIAWRSDRSATPIAAVVDDLDIKQPFPASPARPDLSVANPPPNVTVHKAPTDSNEVSRGVLKFAKPQILVLDKLADVPIAIAKDDKPADAANAEVKPPVVPAADRVAAPPNPGNLAAIWFESPPAAGDWMKSLSASDRVRLESKIKQMLFYVRERRTEKAEELLRELTRQSKEDARLPYLAALGLWEANQPDKSKQLLQQLIQSTKGRNVAATQALVVMDFEHGRSADAAISAPEGPSNFSKDALSLLVVFMA